MDGQADGQLRLLSGRTDGHVEMTNLVEAHRGDEAP